MVKQIPRGDESSICPLHRKYCHKVCHTCPWWQHVRGTNPNTGEEVDKWDCAIALLPLLMLETSLQVRQGAAATESFRNEWVQLSKAQEQMAADKMERAARIIANAHSLRLPTGPETKVISAPDGFPKIVSNHDRSEN
jgi:hypothetical protein